MHEIIIAKQIIDEAKKHGDVKKIIVEVGDLAHLPAEELEPALRNLANWEIRIIKTKATVQCSCGYKGKPKIIEHKHDSVLFECPKCCSLPKVLKGDEIILRKVVVD